MLLIDGHEIPTNEHGYLVDLNDWTETVALTIALQSKIELTDAHWQIIYFIREFYQQYQAIPLMRLFIKAICKQFGDDIGNSIYLNTLFPGGFLKVACKIAGLPKPKHCM